MVLTKYFRAVAMQRLPLATNSINLVHEIINTHHK